MFRGSDERKRLRRALVDVLKLHCHTSESDMIMAAIELLIVSFRANALPHFTTREHLLMAVGVCWDEAHAGASADIAVN